MIARSTAAISVTATSRVNPLCVNSCPPLNPIENNKYSEINREVDSGMLKSLLTMVANTPSRKNNKVGLVRLLSNSSMFIKAIGFLLKQNMAQYVDRQPELFCISNNSIWFELHRLILLYRKNA